MKIIAQDNGIRFVEDIVDAKGQTIHGEFTAKYDGKDYPYTGLPWADRIALKRIDANTFDFVLKNSRKEEIHALMVVSRDGKTMTSTRKQKNPQGQDINDAIVLDKQ